MNWAVVGLGHCGWGAEEEGAPGFLRDNEVFGESSHLLLFDTAGKELPTLIEANQFLDYL